MEKIRSAIRFLRKYHFWFIAVLLLILGVASWYAASSAMIDQFDKDKGSITQNFSTMQQVNGQPNHPNDEHHQEMVKHIIQRRRDVEAAWQVKWEKQKGLLVWPADLPKQFRDEVEKMRPIESIDFDNPKNQLGIWMLESYREFVKRELPKLAEIIGSKWTVTEGDVGTFGGGYGAVPGASSSPYGGHPASGTSDDGGSRGSGYPYAAGGRPSSGYSTSGYGSSGYGSSGYGGWEEEGATPIVVQWSHENQQQLQLSRFDWSLTQTTPKTNAVLYAQEDLWVLASLMEIIKATNGDARHSSQAAIKVIESIQLGRDVQGPVGQVSTVVSTTGTTSSDGGFGEIDGVSSTSMDGGYPPSGAGASDPYGGYNPYGPPTDGTDPMAMLAPDPADMRYVDLNYEPMTAEDLKAKAQSTNPEDAFLAVAKRMPVRIRVLMDSRKISNLLVACANAKLTFEVHQLRLNPPVHAPMGFGGLGGTGYGGSGYGGTGYGAGPGGAAGPLGAAATETPSSGYPPSGSSGYPPSGYASSPTGYGSSSRSAYGSGYGGYGGGYDDPYGEQPDETYDRPVELFGIVYIFNPVDRSKLGGEGTESGGTDQVTATGDEVASATRVGRGL